MANYYQSTTIASANISTNGYGPVGGSVSYTPNGAQAEQQTLNVQTGSWTALTFGTVSPIRYIDVTNANSTVNITSSWVNVSTTTSAAGIIATLYTGDTFHAAYSQSTAPAALYASVGSGSAATTANITYLITPA